MKIRALTCSMKFLFPEVAFYLYKATILPCMECCCHDWVGAPNCYFAMLEKLNRRVCRTVDPLLTGALEPLPHR